MSGKLHFRVFSHSHSEITIPQAAGFTLIAGKSVALYSLPRATRGRIEVAVLTICSAVWHSTAVPLTLPLVHLTGCRDRDAAVRRDLAANRIRAKTYTAPEVTTSDACYYIVTPADHSGSERTYSAPAVVPVPAANGAGRGPCGASLQARLSTFNYGSLFPGPCTDGHSYTVLPACLCVAPP